ncbi:MAG: hypothetical protein U0638_13750 [Phycisphaerales bacterium]
MPRIAYRPLFPDSPGDDVTFIPGTRRKYAATENGNIYRADGCDRVQLNQLPLKPEFPSQWREHVRVRIRLEGDPPRPKRPYHTVPFLMMLTFRRGDWPDYDTGKWGIILRNGKPRDTRLSNLESRIR